MGLLTRLRADRSSISSFGSGKSSSPVPGAPGHQNRGSVATLEKPEPTHAKSHVSNLSVGSSDFSATGSDSSYTSGESHSFASRSNGGGDKKTAAAAASPSSKSKNFSKRKSLYNFGSQEIRTPIKEFDEKLPHPFPQKYTSEDSLPLAVAASPASNVGASTIDEVGEAFGATTIGAINDVDDAPAPAARGLASPAAATSPARGSLDPGSALKTTSLPPVTSDSHSPQESTISNEPLQNDYQPSFYASAQYPYYAPPAPAAPAPAVPKAATNNDSYSSEYESTSSETSSSEEDDDDKSTAAKPSTKEYFDQWRSYYSNIAVQRQQQMQQQYMAAMSRQSVYGFPMMQYGMPGMPGMPMQGMPMNYMQMQQMQMQQMNPYGYQQPFMHPGQASQQSINPYMQGSQTNLVSQSQPDLHQAKEAEPEMLAYGKPRASDSDEGPNELMSASRKSTLKSNRYPSVPSLALSKKGSSSQLRKASVHARISSLDLNFKPKEFNYDAEEEGEKGEKSLSDIAADANVGARYISDYNKFLFEDEEAELESPESAKKESKDNKANQLPTPNSTTESLDRRGSTDSNASFNSIASDASSKFIVGSGKERSERMKAMKDKEADGRPRAQEAAGKAADKTKKKKKERSASPQKERSSSPKQRSQSPLMKRELKKKSSTTSFQDPRLSIVPPLTPTLGPMDPMMNSPYGNPMMNFNTEYSPRQNTDRHSMVNPARFSMIAPGVPGHGATAPKSHDPIINAKINEFTKLRKVIASGNKSIQFRLRWVKMLMAATNYKLYAYINIKGEPIPPEQAAFNKTLFVKSSVTHLVKLLREFEAGKDYHLDVKHEVYFIYACLLKRDYQTSYNQDFGIPKNIPGAVEYFEKCLEMHPTDFKTMYKLGDIYEYELDQFDRAIDYYKQSAKGYNRAIYKISLLYLNVPEIRNIKFLKYLEDLSNIDPLEIRLDAEDSEDLEEVIGLACYQLGRVYEGIYPGDLTSEDDFVQRALQLAPVNYAKSLTYYNKSAKLNCLLAQVKLGSIYEFGELNRPQNANKSIQWYLRAASSPLPFKRHPDAMLGLSRWNVVGSQGASKHIPMPNPDKAFMWCDRAFKEFASPDAAFYMGELTEMGVCPGDPTQWFTRAYEMGHPDASAKLGFA